MSATEGGMGAPGSSSRSYDRAHFLQVDGFLDQDIAATDFNLRQSFPEARRYQIKAPVLRESGVELPENVAGYTLEGNIPFHDVDRSFPDESTLVFYGRLTSTMQEQRAPQHQINRERSLRLARELRVSQAEGPGVRERLLSQVAGSSRVFDLQDSVPPVHLDVVRQLWQASFEWSPEAIAGLLAAADTPGSGTYVSAVTDHRTGEFLSLSFASVQPVRVDLPSGPVVLPVFELTDLITDPRQRSRGAGSACVLGLMNQIQRDYEHPVFMAECNVAAGTHRMLGRLGLTSDFSPEGGMRLLREHVAVGLDGVEYFEPEVLKQLQENILSANFGPALIAMSNNFSQLRDFAVLYLPQSGLSELRNTVFPIMNSLER